jgi:hypothetical protein
MTELIDIGVTSEAHRDAPGHRRGRTGDHIPWIDRPIDCPLRP